MHEKVISAALARRSPFLPLLPTEGEGDAGFALSALLPCCSWAIFARLKEDGRLMMMTAATAIGQQASNGDWYSVWEPQLFHDANSQFRKESDIRGHHVEIISVPFERT